MMNQKKLQLSSAPYLHDQATTPWIMYQVVFSMLPLFVAAYYFFGLSALLVAITSISSCLLTEWFLEGKRTRNTSLHDGSALITGMLLALILPPGMPLWMVFLGGVVSIGMGKSLWGGLGQNVFNPALLGRAFLQAAFPTAITTWSAPDGRYLEVREGSLAWPFFQSDSLDGIASATPLARMKFDHASTDLAQLLLGNTGGSLGETCGLLILIAGIYLTIRGIINWQIPVSIFVTVIIFSGALYMYDSAIYPSPLFSIFSGGLLLGAVFMATDPVASPITAKGRWIYGIGIGILTILIRTWGGLPEGVMYAILLMNSTTPLINRFVKNRVYGT